MASLTLAGIGKRYASAAVLQGVDITVADGEFLVLVGPSGCGKSTLLNIIAGLDAADAGRIEIGGRSVTDVAPKDRDIAMVFQSYALYPTMTVRQNISFGMEVRKVARPEREREIDSVAKVLQIEALLDRKISQLSGGQRQRVAMGRALVRRPAVFLFDEPLSNLDAKLRVEMRTEIKRLHQRLGATIVYVTHDQVEAMTLATRIAVMRAGKVEQLATPRELYEAPVNRFVAGFIGSPAMNFVPAVAAARAGGLVAEIEAKNGMVELPLPRHLSGTAAGRRLTLGIRPEHLVVDGAARVRVGASASALFDAPVEVVEPTGADTMVVVRLGGSDVVARVPPDEARAPGESMRFAVDPERLHLFDAETDVRLS